MPLEVPCSLSWQAGETPQWTYPASFPFTPLLPQEVVELQSWSAELAELLADARRQRGAAPVTSPGASFSAVQAAGRASMWAERVRAGAPAVACVM